MPLSPTQQKVVEILRETPSYNALINAIKIINASLDEEMRALTETLAAFDPSPQDIRACCRLINYRLYAIENVLNAACSLDDIRTIIPSLNSTPQEPETLPI